MTIAVGRVGERLRALMGRDGGERPARGEDDDGRASDRRDPTVPEQRCRLPAHPSQERHCAVSSTVRHFDVPVPAATLTQLKLA